MAGDEEQAKPLSSIAHQTRGHEDEALSLQFLHSRRRKYIHCCGCVIALFLILAVVLLILTFTVFRVRDPKIKMNSATIIQKLEFATGSLKTDVNMTVLIDVSLKNPNDVSFKFGNTTTIIYYNGTLVGEGRSPSGKVKARRTIRVNITVDIIPEKILTVPSLGGDLSSRALTLNSYTRIDGKVKILEVKKSVVVKMNCTLTYNISSQAFQDERCNRCSHLASRGFLS